MVVEVAKWRVLLGVMLLVLTTLFAMSLMLFYRLSILPFAVSSYCGQIEVNEYCVAAVSENLMYNSQWLSFQYIIYFLLSFILYPVFQNAIGSPIVNLLVVGLLSAGLLTLLTDNRGVEVYSSIFNPVFIGLIIHSKRKRRVIFNKA